MNSIPSKQNLHFHFLDALRAIAALWVVFYHIQIRADGLKPLSQFLPHWIYAPIFEWGGLGVAIFFVLSGFVIAHSLRSTVIDFASFKNFCFRRFARLTPPYYASIVFTVGIAWFAARVKGDVLQLMGQELSIPRLLAHLIYVQELLGFVNINDVYWTLCLEVQFYLVFCALLGFVQWLEKQYPSWNSTWFWIVNAAIAVPFPLGLIDVSGRPTFFLGMWYSFLLGVFSYWTWTHKLNRGQFYTYAAVIVVGGIVRSVGFVVVCVLTATVLLEAGRADRMQRWLNWGWIQYLGKISYSIYLMHVPIVGGVYFIVQKKLGDSMVSSLVFLGVAFFASVAGAAISWWLVEKPSIALSRRWGRAQLKTA